MFSTPQSQHQITFNFSLIHFLLPPHSLPRISRLGLGLLVPFLLCLIVAPRDGVEERHDEARNHEHDEQVPQGAEVAGRGLGVGVVRPGDVLGLLQVQELADLGRRVRGEQGRDCKTIGALIRPRTRTRQKYDRAFKSIITRER